MNHMTSTGALRTSAQRPPRLGFLGVGWIGRHRMQAIAAAGVAEIAAVADPSPDAAREAVEAAPGAALADSLDDLLERDLDGLVVATPSALHAAQSIRALERGVAVFCQKPLGRTAEEAAAVVAAARASDRLLGVDLSYRHTDGMEKIRERVRSGVLGQVFAVDLVFHNAYGPDKPWFYDKASSGGGCVMDLGVHLADLALWTLDFPEVRRVDAHLFHQGRPVARDSAQVEDFAVATVELATGAVVRLTCSWRLPAGFDAVIGAAFYGTEGGAELRNVGGSFYDFTARHHRGTASEPLSDPPDAWGGRAAVAWARQLAGGAGFDPACETLLPATRLIDAIYDR